MNDRDALFAAILAHPDEDTPRLALADWLDEHGEAKYAAFVRKQIELADVPYWDARRIAAWNGDRDSLTGNKYELFEPKLPDGLRYPALTSYRRGFPCHVETKGVEPFLDNADWLVAQLPLQALTVRPEQRRWRESVDLAALLASPHLARLKQLNFNLARLSADTVWEVNACPHLANVTELSFEFAGLDAPGLARVFRPPLVERLESLRFHECSLRWRDLAAGLPGAGGPHRLKRLVVSEYSSAYSSNAVAFDAPVVHGLTEFEIFGYEMGPRVFQALCESPVVRGLESLTLSKTNPGVPGAKALAACAELRSLKRLRLTSNRIGPMAATALARSPHPSALQVLDLSDNPLGDKGAIALAEAAFLANLVELDLSSCDIGDAGAEALMNAIPADKMLHLSVGSVGQREVLSAGVRKRLRDKFGDRVSA